MVKTISSLIVRLITNNSSKPIGITKISSSSNNSSSSSNSSIGLAQTLCLLQLKLHLLRLIEILMEKMMIKKRRKRFQVIMQEDHNGRIRIIILMRTRIDSNSMPSINSNIFIIHILPMPMPGQTIILSLKLTMNS